MDKNEERARQMYDRGESPYGWTEKEKIENTQSMVNEQGGNISAADAKDINEKYALNKTSWDTERVEAEIRETEDYIYERREEQAYQNFKSDFLNPSGAERERCEKKIAEIKKAVYKVWGGHYNGKQKYNFCLLLSKESDAKTGSVVNSHIWIEGGIANINSLIYMLSTYRRSIETYKIFDLPFGESIDDKFLSKQRNVEIKADVEATWLMAVKPKAVMSSIQEGQRRYGEDILDVDISTSTVEKVYDQFVDGLLRINKKANLRGEDRHSAEIIVHKIKSAIWCAVCMQEREDQYQGSDEWYRFKDHLWTKSIPISDEVIFILQYYVCCYEVIKERLYNGVDSVEKLVKDGRNDERYPLDKLEEKFAGKKFPKQMFEDIRAGEECRAGIVTNILTLICAFICAAGAGILLKKLGSMDRILVMITVFSMIHVLVTTGTVAYKVFLKIRSVNFLVSSISSGILYWKSCSFICDLAKRTVPVGARYLFCLVIVVPLIYLILGNFFWAVKEETRKMGINQSKNLRKALVGHWIINSITIIVYSILS